MRSLLVLSGVLAITIALQVPKSPEEDPALRRFWFIADDNGKVHFVDTKYRPKFIEPVDGRNFTFRLFTPLNKDEPFLFNGEELDSLYESGVFNPNLPSLIFAHGWGGSGSSRIKNSILAVHDLNVFSLDWSGPAGYFYTQAKEYVNPVGDLIGGVVNEIIDHYQLDPSSIHLMGHSLGGQLIGRIGYSTSGRLGSIIALDPAWPLFAYHDIDGRLDPSDGQFVQVIHTNSGFLGYPYSIGHADFHPNGGVKQPGCGPDIFGVCSHTLISDMILYTYTLDFIGTKCNSFDEYVDGICADNIQASFGGWPVDTSGNGDYFMITDGEPPFVAGH